MTAKSPNLNHRQYFRIYGMHVCTYVHTYVLYTLYKGEELHRRGHQFPRHTEYSEGRISVRNKVAKVVGQMSEHFEFGLDIFNLGRTLFVGSSCHIMQRKIHCKTITSYIISQQFTIKISLSNVYTT